MAASTRGWYARTSESYIAVGAFRASGLEQERASGREAIGRSTRWNDGRWRNGRKSGTVFLKGRACFKRLPESRIGFSKSRAMNANLDSPERKWNINLVL